MDANRRKLLKVMGLGWMFPYISSLEGQTNELDLLQIPRAQWSSDHFLNRICLGSCNNEDRSQEFWSVIAAQSPDLFLSLGDNIYGDSFRSSVLRKKYKRLKNNPNYLRFIKEVPMYGTWDDHDYGWNNAGSDYRLKYESQQIFCDFFNESKNSLRRQRDGIYHSYTFNGGDQQVKLILLDTRFNRDESKQLEAGESYAPNDQRDILGARQWEWFEEELRTSKAHVHLIATSIPILANSMRVTEDWDKFPWAYQKMFELLSLYRPSGTVFLSGDKHFAGIFKREIQGHQYVELMSSGLTHSAPLITRPVIRAVFRGEDIYLGKNFAQIDFNFSRKKMRLVVKTIEGDEKISSTWPIGEFI